MNPMHSDPIRRALEPYLADLEYLAKFGVPALSKVTYARKLGLDRVGSEEE